MEPEYAGVYLHVGQLHQVLQPAHQVQHRQAGGGLGVATPGFSKLLNLDCQVSEILKIYKKRSRVLFQAVSVHHIGRPIL